MIEDAALENNYEQPIERKESSGAALAKKAEKGGRWRRRRERPRAMLIAPASSSKQCRCPGSSNPKTS